MSTNWNLFTIKKQRYSMILRTKILLLAATGLLAMAAGCSRDAAETLPPADAPIPTGYGTLSLSSITVSQTETEIAAGNAAGNGVVTRAVDTDNFMLYIERHAAPWYSFAPRKLSERTTPIVLPVGSYTLRVASPEVALPAWDAPAYSASADFDLTEGENEVINLTCRQSNLKVTVQFGEGIWNEIDHSQDVKVTVSVNNPGNTGSLEFLNRDPSAGYFAVSEGDRMTVTLEATISSTPQRITETVRNLAPGQWQRLRFVLEGDNTFMMTIVDNEIGPIDDGVGWGQF
jgi:hypothetical protein